MTLTQTREWGGLRSQFLADLDPAEQSHIFDLSAQSRPALEAWAARFPLIRRVRVAPLSLSVAAGAPFGTVEAVISTARGCLWIFTLDDLFDEAGLSHAELIERADRYRALVRREIPCPTGDSLAVALCEVRDDLAGYPLFESLEREWTNALCGTIDGMLAEYRWSLAYASGLLNPPAPLPSYAEYVSTGRYSIGGPPHMWAAVITADDASTAIHLDHLRAMEQLASTCIRLANDLQSYEKEIAEGQINSLVILSRALRDQGVSEADALQQAATRVRADIVAGLHRLAALRTAAVTDTGQPEAVIDNIARFVCEFYTHHDFHTFRGQPA
jgi:hypothetical protein